MVTLDKKEGGLGIRDFRVMDEAKMMKWIIAIWENKGTAWCKWMNR